MFGPRFTRLTSLAALVLLAPTLGVSIQVWHRHGDPCSRPAAQACPCAGSHEQPVPPARVHGRHDVCAICVAALNVTCEPPPTPPPCELRCVLAHPLFDERAAHVWDRCATRARGPPAA